ncbi:MAG: response regulator [Candidatus Limivivens sp.]|nr:response regulator [Candidatus Limivivens sp.]
MLVVEDEVYARKSLVKMITEYARQKEFRILEAENGEAALEVMKTEKLDLVMADIRMPKLDGLGLLKQIKARDSSLQVVMLSAYSEFEYARASLRYGAFDYLLKPVSDEALKECLDQFLYQDMQQKRETVITGQDAVTRFIMCRTEDSSYDDFIGRNLFRKIFEKYQVLMISFPQDARIEAEEIFHEVEQMFQQEMWTAFRMFRKEKQIWVLVINVEQDSFFFPRKLIRFFEKRDCHIRIGVSREHTVPDEIGNAVEEARDALICKLFQPDRILIYDQISQKEASSFRLGQNEEMLLRQALKNRSRKKTEEALQQIFRKIHEKPLIRRDSLELFFNQMKVIMQEAQHGDGIQFQEGFSSILSFDSMQDLEDSITQICKNISNLFEKERGEESSDVIEQIVNYVSAHYEQDISLKELAENQLYMNSTYVSHRFAERMGISFSAWLRGVRIGHAKKFLENGEWSITEVASMSGYNDTSQFIRAFRQETGVTPKKYRDAARGKNRSGCVKNGETGKG